MQFCIHDQHAYSMTKSLFINFIAKGDFPLHDDHDDSSPRVECMLKSDDLHTSTGN